MSRDYLKLNKCNVSIVIVIALFIDHMNHEIANKAFLTAKAGKHKHKIIQNFM